MTSRELLREAWTIRNAIRKTQQQLYDMDGDGYHYAMRLVAIEGELTKDIRWFAKGARIEDKLAAEKR